jgi:hypothetical protein
MQMTFKEEMLEPSERNQAKSKPSSLGAGLRFSWLAAPLRRAMNLGAI